MAENKFLWFLSLVVINNYILYKIIRNIFLISIDYMEFRIKLVKILKKSISYRVVKVPLSLKRRKKDKRPEMYI